MKSTLGFQRPQNQASLAVAYVARPGRYRWVGMLPKPLLISAPLFRFHVRLSDNVQAIFREQESRARVGLRNLVADLFHVEDRAEYL
jgi:hypothetical protein